MHAGHQSGGDGFHVTFYSADLSGKEDLWMGFHLQGVSQQRGSIDVGVAVNLSIAQEAGVFEAGDQAQDLGLIGELKVILKSDQVVGIGTKIFLAKLNYGVGNVSGAGIFEAYRLHWTEAKRVSPSASNFFDGETAFEIVEVLPVSLFDGMGRQECVVEGGVFGFGHGAVDVVG